MKFDYSTIARRIALRHPLLSDIGTQIIFWIFAYLLFFALVNFISKAVVSLFNPDAIVHISENLLIALTGAIILGTLLGITDYFVEKKLNKKSIGFEILIKTVFYLIIWFIAVNTTQSIGFAMEARFIDNTIIDYDDEFFKNLGASSSIYTFVMMLVISFIKQMNNKFGPGIILPMFLGKYRKPRVEERIFMFLDLKSSTTYAEKLGHLKYSEMIQSCFLDLNKVIAKHYAEIYQYVGDEVVLTWLKEEGLSNLNCINFFFEYKELLVSKKDAYISKFGFIPEFKASAHIGEITVAEVGDIKRDIAYHGDTINTASRIQALCNKYNTDFLISENLKNSISSNNELIINFVDEIILKGRTENTKFFAVSQGNK